MCPYKLVNHCFPHRVHYHSGSDDLARFFKVLKTVTSNDKIFFQSFFSKWGCNQCNPRIYLDDQTTHFYSTPIMAKPSCYNKGWMKNLNLSIDQSKPSLDMNGGRYIYNINFYFNSMSNVRRLFFSQKDEVVEFL